MKAVNDWPKSVPVAESIGAGKTWNDDGTPCGIDGWIYHALGLKKEGSYPLYLCISNEIANALIEAFRVATFNTSELLVEFCDSKCFDDTNRAFLFNTMMAALGYTEGNTKDARNRAASSLSAKEKLIEYHLAR